MSDSLFTSEEGSTAQPPRAEAVSERAVHPAPAIVDQPKGKGQGGSPGCLSLVLAAVVAAVVATVVSAAICTVVLSLGSLSGGGLGGFGQSTQQGEVSIGTADRQEVYYPTPYEGQPNLQLQANGKDDWSSVILLEEQKPDHFTIKSKAFGLQPAVRIHWRAEGSPKSK